MPTLRESRCTQLLLLNLSRRGKPLPEEHRLKIKVARNLPEAKAKVSAFHKGRKHSPETKHKISIAMKGRKLSEHRIAAIKEKANMLEVKIQRRTALLMAWARPGAKERRIAILNMPITKARLSAVSLQQWSNPESRAKIINAMNQPESKARMIAKLSGASSSSWQGGKSFEPYTVEFNRQLKCSIRERDNYTCQLCTVVWQHQEASFPVHHIDYNKENCAPDNLITLCALCHTKTNHRRDYYTGYFQAYMAKRAGEAICPL